MASSEYQCTYAAPVPVIRRLFDKSQFAVSTEETRYYLNGVYLHVVDEGGARRSCAPSRPTVTGWRASMPTCPRAPRARRA